MTWILSYVGANFALILVVLLAVAGCALIFWITKNLWAVVTAGVILMAGFAYMQIDKNAFARAVAEQAAEKIEILQGRLDTINGANQANAERALAANARIAELETKAGETPANSTACGDEGFAKRVGDIR